MLSAPKQSKLIRCYLCNIHRKGPSLPLNKCYLDDLLGNDYDAKNFATRETYTRVRYPKAPLTVTLGLGLVATN